MNTETGGKTKPALPDIHKLHWSIERGDRSISLEDEIENLMFQLSTQLFEDNIVVMAVESLLHRLGKAVVARHKELFDDLIMKKDSVSWESDSIVWIAAQWLMDIGNLSSKELESAKKAITSKYTPLNLRIAFKAQFIVAQDLIGKMMVKSGQTLNSFPFNSHPLIGPLADWLSRRDNQHFGGAVVKKNTEKFLAIMSRRMIGHSDWSSKVIRPDVRLTVIESPKACHNLFMNNMASAFVNAIPTIDRDRCLGLNMVTMGLIEAVPELVKTLWGSVWFHGNVGPHNEKQYEKLMELIYSPTSETTVEDLEKVMPLPNHFLEEHFTTFYQLWPKWREAKLAESV